MWSPVTLDEFAALLRRQRRSGNRAAPLYPEACGEAGIVLGVTLSLAVIATYLARAMGWS